MINPVFSLVDDCVYETDEDVISEFRSYLEPYNETQKGGALSELDLANNERFLYICNYLNEKGYVVKQLPNLLREPKNRFAASDQIRMLVLQKKKSNPVRWSDRRLFISKLVIEKTTVDLSKDTKTLLESISTNSTAFSRKTNDEKLADLCNAIENLLKPSQNSPWIQVDSHFFLEIVDDETIRAYRKLLQPFRHSTKDHLAARKAMSEQTKAFLVDYGIVLVKHIKVWLSQRNSL